MKSAHTGSADTQSECFTVKFNSDGNYAMTGHADRSVRLWNANTQGEAKEVALFDEGHNREIFDLSIFADNDKFVTCGGDKMLFQGADWYWFTTGVTRAVRKGLVSLQENWRYASIEGVGKAFNSVFRDIESGVVPQTWVFRHTLTDPTPDFETLLLELSSNHLAAPYYIGMAGVNPNE